MNGTSWKKERVAVVDSMSETCGAQSSAQQYKDRPRKRMQAGLQSEGEGIFPEDGWQAVEGLVECWVILD